MKTCLVSTKFRFCLNAATFKDLLFEVTVGNTSESKWFIQMDSALPKDTSTFVVVKLSIELSQSWCDLTITTLLPLSS